MSVMKKQLAMTFKAVIRGMAERVGGPLAGTMAIRVQCVVPVAFAVVCMAVVSAPLYAADRTISSDYTLTADETVDGVLTVDAESYGNGYRIKKMAEGLKVSLRPGFTLLIK